MKLVITGDISTWNIKDFNIEKFNPDILNILKSSDAVIYNLEGPIGDKSFGNSVFSENRITDIFLKGLNAFINKEQPLVFSDTKILDLLKINPKTVVTMANNHIKDLGLEGYLNTIKILEENNIKYVGGEEKGKDNSRRDIGNISVFNFNFIGKKYIFNLYGSGKQTFGASSASFNTINNKILQAKKEGRKTILILHIGKEMVEDIGKWDVELEEIKKLEADITVIHHPHTYIQTEYEKDNIFILGDFLFNRSEKFDPDRKTALLQIEERDNTVISSLTKIPVSDIYKY